MGDEKTVYRHTKTISIVSDSTVTRVKDGDDIFKTPPSVRSAAWSRSKSPSEASFYSFTSDQFYDVVGDEDEKPTRLSLGDNPGFELGEGDGKPALMVVNLPEKSPEFEAPAERPSLHQQYWQCSHYSKREACFIIAILVLSIFVIAELGLIIYLFVSQSGSPKGPMEPTASLNP